MPDTHEKIAPGMRVPDRPECAVCGKTEGVGIGPVRYIATLEKCIIQDERLIAVHEAKSIICYPCAATMTVIDLQKANTHGVGRDVGEYP